jgi:hypothetical protein
MKKTGFTALLLVLAAAELASAQNVVVIGAPQPYGTTGPGVDYAWFTEYNQWLSQGFTTPAAVIDVSSIQLWFDSQTALIPPIGTFVVSLNTALSTDPLAGSLWSSTLDSPSGLISFALTGVTLAASTEYFITVSNSQASGVPPNATPALAAWLVSNGNTLGNVDPSFYWSGNQGSTCHQEAQAVDTDPYSLRSSAPLHPLRSLV